MSSFLQRSSNKKAQFSPNKDDIFNEFSQFKNDIKRKFEENKPTSRSPSKRQNFSQLSQKTFLNIKQLQQNTRIQSNMDIKPTIQTSPTVTLAIDNLQKDLRELSSQKSVVGTAGTAMQGSSKKILNNFNNFLSPTSISTPFSVKLSDVTKLNNTIKDKVIGVGAFQTAGNNTSLVERIQLKRDNALYETLEQRQQQKEKQIRRSETQSNFIFKASPNKQAVDMLNLVSPTSTNINQLLEESKLKMQCSPAAQNFHRSYKEQLKHKAINFLIPLQKIHEIQDILIDSSDQEINEMPRSYMEELIKLSSIIMFRVKTSNYYKRGEFK